MQVQVLSPVTITDAMLSACSVGEPVPASLAWVSGTAYAIGDIRSRVSTQRRYRRLTVGAGTTPPESDAANWLDVGAEPVGLKWVSGTTYAVGDLRISAGRTYRRLVAGAGATLPALDAANWLDVGAAPDEVAWLASESYSIGDAVIRATTHRAYTALVAGVDAGLPEATPACWVDSGPTNKWAAFDLYRSTAMTQAGTLTMTLKPGVITGMAFFGLQGDSLRVVCRPATGGAVYFDQSYSLSEYLSGDLMWEFYYSTPRQQDGLRIGGLYPNDAQVEITLTPSAVTGKAAIGILALGSFEPLGLPQYGFRAQPVDYSRITADAYGNTRIVRGLSAKNISGECLIEAADANAVADVIYRLLGIPCAWVVTDNAGYDYLNAFGLGSADITAAGPNHANLSLTIRGLI